MYFCAVLILKKTVAFLLFFGVMANCFNYLLMQEGYEFNKAYISSVLCSNKDKPHLHCDGKCFLDLKLKELEKKNKAEQENLKRSVESKAEPKTTLPAPTYKDFNHQANFCYLANHTDGHLNNIFHPPLV